jgi:hypothetical protein
MIMKKPYWVVTLAATLMGVILMVVEITATAAPPTGTKNVVLVLGAFADGSGREAVAKILEKDGHTVPVAQPPRRLTPMTKSTRELPSTPWAGRPLSSPTAPAVSHFMAQSQAPISTDSFTHKVTSPAWKTKPAWYMVATADRSIYPNQEPMMAKRANAKTGEVNASDVAYMSHPKEAGKLVEEAATSEQVN